MVITNIVPTFLTSYSYLGMEKVLIFFVAGEGWRLLSYHLSREVLVIIATPVPFHPWQYFLHFTMPQAAGANMVNWIDYKLLGTEGTTYMGDVITYMGDVTTFWISLVRNWSGDHVMSLYMLRRQSCSIDPLSWWWNLPSVMNLTFTNHNYQKGAIGKGSGSRDLSLQYLPLLL